MHRYANQNKVIKARTSQERLLDISQ